MYPKRNSKRNSLSKGQAVVEYILLLGIMAFVSVRMVKGLSSFMGGSVKSLADAVQTHLTVGVCDKNCFYSGYKNGREN